MPIKLLIFFFITICLFAQEDKLNIAVMELDGNGIPQSDLGGLSNRLRTELFLTEKYNVIERSRMNEILTEQGFQQTGCANAECAVEVGQLIGVRKIIIGSVDKVGTIFSADVRMVNVETGEIERIAVENCEDCSINDVLKTTIHNVARVLSGLGADREVERKIIQKPQKGSQNQINVEYELKEWEKIGLTKEKWLKFKRSGLKNYQAYRKKRGGVFLIVTGGIFVSNGLFWTIWYFAGDFVALSGLLPMAIPSYALGGIEIPIGCLLLNKSKKIEKNRMSINSGYNPRDETIRLTINYSF